MPGSGIPEHALLYHDVTLTGAALQDARARTVSFETPGGIDANSGQRAKNSVAATYRFCFGVPKTVPRYGNPLLHPSAYLTSTRLSLHSSGFECDQLYLVDIGLPERLICDMGIDYSSPFYSTNVVQLDRI